ncbi:MAG: peptidylprolyl isomerase [Proteobacteria bacterium]|nr:peptidylprolyl isomerase [Pseudomonadota bacterium]
MKFLLVSILFFLVFCDSALAQVPRPSSRIVLVDRIVAVVNTEVITQYELQSRLRQIQAQLKQQGTPLPAAGVLDKQVLERLIVDRVQLQLARETALRVDDQQLDRAIERIAQENKMSLPQFRQALEKDGISYPSFREDIRTEIVLTRLREREVESKIVVSDGEVDLFLEAQGRGGQTDAGSEYNLAHILVRLPEQASPEQIQRQRARMESVQQQLKSGGDFSQLAASFSDAPDALQGGQMGWRAQDRMPELFAEPLAKMRPGEISGILRSPAGFHLLRLIDKRGGGGGGAGTTVVIVDQTRVRHILIKTNEAVAEDEAKRKIVNIRERIILGGDFAELARLNSEDGSGSKGGELGLLYPGDTVPEFERAMNELPVNKVSEPVRSPFGWHLIEVLERRKADMSDDRKRAEVRRILRERKSDEAFNEWVRQLRDRAYVEFRLEEK